MKRLPWTIIPLVLIIGMTIIFVSDNHRRVAETEKFITSVNRIFEPLDEMLDNYEILQRFAECEVMADDCLDCSPILYGDDPICGASYYMVVGGPIPVFAEPPFEVIEEE